MLHRRSPLIREKVIHEMRMEPVRGVAAGPGGGDRGAGGEEGHFAIVDMRTSAGTYIKEFVHGDIGRTKPSLGHLLAGDGDGAGAPSLQILQLDVSDVIV